MSASFKSIVIQFLFALCFFTTAKAAPTDALTLESQRTSSFHQKGLTLHAKSSFFDNEKDTTELSEDVQVIFKGQHLRCKKAVISWRTNTIDASGDVLVVSSKNTIGGSRVILDLETNTGIIYDGFVQSGTVLFEGSSLIKTSDTDFTAEDARYTTCTNCPESWSFTGTKIQAELGGYAYIRSSTLRFGGLPVFWMPYLLVPLKSDRQSGLLTPDFETSKLGGLTIAESYFWAMNRSHDSTWTLKNYELRGLKGLVNYRYVLDERSQGELDAGLITDRQFSSEPRLNNFRSTGDLVSRWFIRYDHNYQMPNGYTHRVNLNNASDLQYSKDFPLETRNNGDPAMENRISIFKSSANFSWGVDSSYYINLLQSNPLATNNDAVHRLPEFTFQQGLTPIGKSKFYYAWNTTYTNFARGSFAFDTMNTGYVGSSTNRYRKPKNNPPAVPGDCASNTWEKNPNCYYDHNTTFDQSKDLIRSGQRIDSNIHLERPFSVGRLDFLPRMSYRETDYFFTVGSNSSIARRYVRTDISGRTVFSQVFNQKNNQDRLKHEIQPEITATAIPWMDHPAHPFFGDLNRSSPFSSQNNVSDSDLNSPYGLQFDYGDRTFDRKLVNFALVNRLIEKKWSNGAPSYRQFFTWKIAQAYDFYQAENSGQPWSDFVSDMVLSLDRINLYQSFNYFHQERKTNSTSKIRFIDSAGDFFQIGYSINYNITPGQTVDINQRTEQYALSFKKSITYLDLIGKVVFDINPPSNRPDQRINSHAIGAQIRLPGECWYFRLLHYRQTDADENFRFTFDFSFDGNPKPALPESLLDSYSL